MQMPNFYSKKVCGMKNILKAFTVLILCIRFLYAQTETTDSFKIRGMLPWHNFLSGPTAWNLDDYKNYLDDLQKHGINFIGFHNYTGGGQRYATYVEPIIKIQYKNILPEAYLDNSLTSRWGYTPMKIADFAFSSSEKFQSKYKNSSFGADCSIESNSKEEHYQKTQRLMQEVVALAHQRGIQVAIGFEFGVHPPEYFSLYNDPDFYWPGESNMIPNPANYQSIEILYATLTNILETYPSVDYIWLWLNEHSFMGVNLEGALNTPSFKNIYDKDQHLFSETMEDKSARFIGVWSLEYIRLAHEFLVKKKSNAKIIVGGWGGGNQLPAIMLGLDKGLPKDIIFSLLNPDLGKKNPPQFLVEIAKNRNVISIPWLEGDNQLWQLQPRVDLMQTQVRLAKQMNMMGVAAIHWRTEETKINFEAFVNAAHNPTDTASVKNTYQKYFAETCGNEAAQILSEEFAKYDLEKWYPGDTPEYYAYTPAWGQMPHQDEAKFQKLLIKIEKAIANTTINSYKENLNWWRAKIKFMLLLNEVGRKLEPAYKLRSEYLVSKIKLNKEKLVNVKTLFLSAPVKELFNTFSASVRSKGELGELSSINQKLWREYLELQKFLDEHTL